MLAFSGARRAQKKAPFAGSPSLHILSDSGIQLSWGLLRVIPFSVQPCVSFELRRQRSPRSASRTHGAVRGVLRGMDERCRDRATRSTPTRADSTQKASRETAITISLQRTALTAHARTHTQDTHTHKETRALTHRQAHTHRQRLR